MYKRCLPLALALAYIPNAYAFPPCPKDGVQLFELPNSSATQATPFWYEGYYGLVGNPLVTGGLKDRTDADLTSKSGNVPSNGKCHDRVRIPMNNVSNGIVPLQPVYPEGAGFGIVALPDLRYGTPDNLGIFYRLGFSVDNFALANSGEWLDIAQLEFRWNVVDDPKDPASAVYRIRKTQHAKKGLVIEVIETRTEYPAIGMRPPVRERVVATIPTLEGQFYTPIALRWTQVIAPRHDIEPPGEIGLPIDEPAAISSIEGGLVKDNVTSSLEVIDPNGKMIYSIALPAQWANSLSMGLLDYHIEKASDYADRFGAEMKNTSLSAWEF